MLQQKSHIPHHFVCIILELDLITETEEHKQKYSHISKYLAQIL